MLFYDTLSFGRYDGREHAWVDYEDNKRKTSLRQLHSSCKKKKSINTRGMQQVFDIVTEHVWHALYIYCYCVHTFLFQM